MKDFTSPFFKARPNTSKQFSAVLQEQRDFVDRELLVQQFLESHNKDIRNLETFISPGITTELKMDVNNPEFLWEFCSELAEAIHFGYTTAKGKKKYIGLRGNGLFTSLCFVPKAKRSTVLEVSEWASNMMFTEI
jgi:hypothetical protein